LCDPFAFCLVSRNFSGRNITYYIKVLKRDNEGNIVQRVLFTEELEEILRQIEAETMETV